MSKSKNQKNASPVVDDAPPIVLALENDAQKLGDEMSDASNEADQPKKLVLGKTVKSDKLAQYAIDLLGFIASNEALWQSLIDMKAGMDNAPAMKADKLAEITQEEANVNASYVSLMASGVIMPTDPRFQKVIEIGSKLGQLQAKKAEIEALSPAELAEKAIAQFGAIVAQPIETFTLNNLGEWVAGDTQAKNGAGRGRHTGPNAFEMSYTTPHGYGRHSKVLTMISANALPHDWVEEGGYQGNWVLAFNLDGKLEGKYSFDPGTSNSKVVAGISSSIGFNTDGAEANEKGVNDTDLTTSKPYKKSVMSLPNLWAKLGYEKYDAQLDHFHAIAHTDIPVSEEVEPAANDAPPIVEPQAA